jgi:hypothetical protein
MPKKVISFEEAKKINYEYNFRSKRSYYKLCEIETNLPIDPEKTYYGRFLGWIDYLGIEGDYYDLETCHCKVKGYIKDYPELRQCYPDILKVAKKLCKIDEHFPPYDLWVEYYRIPDLSVIINRRSLNLLKKRSSAIIL